MWPSVGSPGHEIVGRTIVMALLCSPHCRPQGCTVLLWVVGFISSSAAPCSTQETCREATCRGLSTSVGCAGLPWGSSHFKLAPSRAKVLFSLPHPPAHLMAAPCPGASPKALRISFLPTQLCGAWKAAGLGSLVEQGRCAWSWLCVTAGGCNVGPGAGHSKVQPLCMAMLIQAQTLFCRCS